MLKYPKSGIVIYIHRRKKNYKKKKSCYLVCRVAIDLPFEGRKVEGSRKMEDGREFHRREVEGEEAVLTLTYCFHS